MNTFSQIVANYIGKLSDQHLVLFCILNCEKMLPGYKIFTQIEDWGDISAFNTAIDESYLHLFSPLKESFWEDLETKLDLNYPDLDDFHSASASYAFDTCGAFDELIQFLKTKEKVHVVRNAQSCINTVDMFIQQKENIGYVTNIDELEQLIEHDPYMVNERNRQLNLLEELFKAPLIDNQFIDSLKLVNQSFGAIIDINVIIKN